MGLPLVILCGGLNTRLGPLSQSIYKPFLELQGSTFVAKYIERARREGITRVVVITDEVDQLVSRLLGRIRESVPGVQIDEILAPGPLENKLRAAGEGPFLLCLGDTFAWFSFEELASLGASKGYEAAMVVGQYRSPFGHVHRDGTVIRSFTEKPASAESVNLGQLYLSRAALLRLESADSFQGLLADLAAEGSLAALDANPREFLTLDTIADVLRADASVADLGWEAAN